jgi:hypothetical protein
MVTIYNILFKKDESNVFIPAFATFKNHYKYSSLVISTTDNINNLDNKIIMDTIIIKKDNDIIHNNIFMEFYINTAIIKFDNNNRYAFEDFIVSINNIINISNDFIKYESGNIKYVGDLQSNINILDRYYDGIGTLFYDTLYSKNKYVGDFSDGNFDGSGIFYMKYDNISIIANNISDGIPQFFGTLQIKYPNYTESYNIDFDSIFKNLNLTTREEQQSFVASDDFVYIIAKDKWNNNKPLDDCIIESLNNNDRINFIYEKLTNIDEDNKITFHKIKTCINQIDKESFTNFTIILILYFVIISCNIYFLIRYM